MRWRLHHTFAGWQRQPHFVLTVSICTAWSNRGPDETVVWLGDEEK